MQEPTKVLLEHAKRERFVKRKRVRVDEEVAAGQPDFLTIQSEIAKQKRDEELDDFEFLAGLALSNDTFKPQEKKYVEPPAYPDRKGVGIDDKMGNIECEKLFAFEMIDRVERHKYLVPQSGPFHMFTAQELEQDPFIVDTTNQYQE